ncbi:hypothetical protein ACJJIL_04960 [Microbulbifer sp. EKSA005]|uniref:hypothetical protein n=1 Tax=Microbulbifer sp. EKSA005 TaxID=3243364 RepID=UPI004042221E
MKKYASLSLLGFLIGCSHQAHLVPLSAGSDDYIMFYNRSDVQISMRKGVTPEQRNTVYEGRVKLILNTDPVTSSCVVIEGSVNFGEPGSSGTAKVKCPNPLPLEKDGMYNQDGSESYRYKLKAYESI